MDSLEIVYSSGRLDTETTLKVLKALAISHRDLNKRLAFCDLLIEEAAAVDSVQYVFQGYLEKGHTLRAKGDLSDAMKSYFVAVDIVKGDNFNAAAKTYISIADVYAFMDNWPNAKTYYNRALQILRQEKDSLNIASALSNFGDGYANVGSLDTAMMYTQEAEVIFQKIHYELGQAYCLGNIGIIYAKQDLDLKAEYYMNKAILTLEKINDYYPIAVYLTFISDIYLSKNDFTNALKYANKSMLLAHKHGMKKEVSDAYLLLSKIYEKQGQPTKAYEYYKIHIVYKDSVNNITSVQQMADMRTNFEVSKKQIEVDLLNQQKKNREIIVLAIIIALVLTGLLAFGLFRRYKYIKQTNKIIDEERGRSEALLLNILPRETAQELKEHGRVKAKRYESVSVLFTDFKEFTRYAEQSTPELLVETVDFYFSKFDQIIAKYELEKIKTIGDSYMCAGGIHSSAADAAVKSVRAAIEIAEFVHHTKETNDKINGQFDIRIGINTGPVVAGIVGTTKFAYDIWGDAVNVAARMESASEPGRINISENTYNLIKDVFKCEYRGELEAKNMGTMKMYFVKP